VTSFLCLPTFQDLRHSSWVTSHGFLSVVGVSTYLANPCSSECSSSLSSSNFQRGLFSLFSMPLRVQVPQFGSHSLQPTQLFSRFACLSPKKSKCSKWLNSNFINNRTLLILFHDCWNLQMYWMYGCVFEKCMHY